MTEPRTLLAFAAAFCLAATPALAANAPPRPSFDCPAATSAAERLICANAGLARLDVQAAALYAQARAKASDADALKKEQLAWLRQRDTECIAGASYAQVRRDPEVRECLAARYASRINALRDQVAPPLQPAGLVSVSPKVLAQIGLARKGCIAGASRLDGAGQTLALEVNCDTANLGRRVWLIAADGQRAAPATPDLGAGDPNGEAVFGTGTELLWDTEILYVFTTMQGMKTRRDEDPAWGPRQFSATLAGSPMSIDKLPARIQARRDARAERFPAGDPGKLIDDPDMIGETALWLGVRTQAVAGESAGRERVRREGTLAVWLRALADETYALLVKSTEKPGNATELARGGAELGSLRHDNWHLLYPTPTGLLLSDLRGGPTRRIAGTGVGDLPLAWQPVPGGNRLAWLSQRPCGGAPGETAVHLCLASVPGTTAAGKP